MRIDQIQYSTVTYSHFLVAVNYRIYYNLTWSHSDYMTLTLRYLILLDWFKLNKWKERKSNRFLNFKICIIKTEIYISWNAVLKTRLKTFIWFHEQRFKMVTHVCCRSLCYWILKVKSNITQHPLNQVFTCHNSPCLVDESKVTRLVIFYWSFLPSSR